MIKTKILTVIMYVQMNIYIITMTKIFMVFNQNKWKIAMVYAIYLVYKNIVYHISINIRKIIFYRSIIQKKYKKHSIYQEMML
jgi:hypothetical protein